jgi:hypothetical protein
MAGQTSHAVVDEEVSLAQHLEIRARALEYDGTSFEVRL